MRSWRRSPAASARLALSRAAHDAGGAGGAGAGGRYTRAPSRHVRTRRGRVSWKRASSRQTCTGPGTLRGPVCRGRANSRPMCTDPVHMGALLAGSRELGPDEYHHWLNHVRNCETCTGPFVKTLIARLVYLVLCGIRLISHGTRLARVCIFRYTWAGSCHGWNSYGTRRPRVCGVPYVPASRVPAGCDLRTHEGRVCRPPANWGQACTAGAPPGTRPVRVSCNRAISRPTCTDAKPPRTREARVHAGHASSRPMCTGAPRAPPPRPGSPPRRPRYRCRSKCPLRARFLRLMTVPCMPWGM